MPWTLYDFIDLRGRNQVSLWIDDLETRMQARLKAKLQTIRTAGPALPPGMVTPTPGQRHVQEIVFGGRAGAFRLFLCRSPGNPLSELTLLCGGQEKDNRYLTNRHNHTPAHAEEFRKQLILNVTERQRKHEFFIFLG